ncbi:MAG TPA: 50S ribosomal protein L25 [Dehalococcoidia bacterium]|nr:50S ribosomal protein L25 [Dehalococcoidia bacterium]
MDSLTLIASKRDILGKKARFLRRKGITPTHLFGHNLKSLPLQCDTAELQRIIARAQATRLINLEIEGEKQPRSILIREIQRAEPGGQLLHVDFYQVRKTEKITVDVPIVLVGEAPALKEKGRLLTLGVTSLSIECLPAKLPSRIEANLSSLEEPEQTIRVSNLTLPPNITVITGPDQLVVKIGEAAVERVEERVAKAEEQAEETVAEEPE